MKDHPKPPSRRQGVVLDLIVRTFQVTREPVSAHYLSRRLGISPPTVRDHLESLHRKGWLVTEGSPARPRPDWLAR